jgi:hypothetical protein
MSTRLTSAVTLALSSKAHCGNGQHRAIIGSLTDYLA